MLLGYVAKIDRNSTAHAPRQWGSALQGLHCPLPRGSAAVHCRSSALKAATASWAQLPAGVLLRAAPKRCGSALKELYYPRPPSSEAARCRR